MVCTVYVYAKHFLNRLVEQMGKTLLSNMCGRARLAGFGGSLVKWSHWRSHYVFQCYFIYINNNLTILHTCIFNTCTPVYARTRTREGVNTCGLKFTNIKFKCDGGVILGRGERMHGRVRGIALLCVQMMNHHTFRREKFAMQLTELLIDFDHA